MIITISSRTLPVTRTVELRTHRRMRRAFASLSKHVVRVDVALEEIQGGEALGDDKVVTARVSLSSGLSVSVEAIRRKMDKAIRVAIRRLRAATKRTLVDERRREQRRLKFVRQAWRRALTA